MQFTFERQAWLPILYLLLSSCVTVEPRLTTTPFIRPPLYYGHPVYKTTSLLRPYSFKPNVKTIESFSYFEDPVNATTSLLRPGFYGPTVVALTGFHCIKIYFLMTKIHPQLKTYTLAFYQVFLLSFPSFSFFFSV